MSRAERVDNSPYVAIASPNLARVYDEPFRRAPQKKERIAGDQCQVAPGDARQHANSRRRYDFRFRDREPRCARRSLQGNHVISMNVAQRAEVGIAMRGDSDVAAAGRKRRPWNMSRSLAQDSGVIAFEDHHRQSQPRNIKFADHVTAAHWRRWHGAMDFRRSVQPFLGTPLRCSLFLQAPPVPPKQSSAPDDEDAAEPNQESPPSHGRLGFKPET